MKKQELKYWNKGFRTAFVLATVVYVIALIIILQSFSNRLESIIKILF